MNWPVFFLVALFKGCSAELILEISQGEILGIRKLGLDDVPYVSYMGIPYAKPPVGHLRFRPPEEAECWDGILDATTEGPNCMQDDVFFGSLHQSKLPMQEDCLYINVHTPALGSDDNLPVFFFVHGGGFAYGSGDTDILGPDFLVSKGVILVTFNYRLDVYGFMSLDIAEAPGNLALRDITAALIWVNKNIAVFGGNADEVTVGGVSAGATLAHTLTMLYQTEGMFRRLILMSGNTLEPWAISHNNTAQAFEFGAKLNYTTTNATELYNLLRVADSSDMLDATKALLTEKGALNFQLVIEKTFVGVDSFLTENPYDIIKSGKQRNIPYLMGTTSREGISFLGELIGLDYDMVINSSAEALIPLDINTSKLTSEEITELEAKMKSFVLDNGTISEEAYNNNIIDWISDVFVVYRIIVLARLRTSATCSPVYMYQFSLDGEFDIIKEIRNTTQFIGVGHLEDLAYLFKVNSFPKTMVDGSNEDKARRLMLELWTNFIKYGNPTPETNDIINIKWKPTSAHKLSYVNITTTISAAQEPEEERIAFWDDIYTSVGMPIGISQQCEGSRRPCCHWY